MVWMLIMIVWICGWIIEGIISIGQEGGIKEETWVDEEDKVGCIGRSMRMKLQINISYHNCVNYYNLTNNLLFSLLSRLYSALCLASNSLLIIDNLDVNNCFYWSLVIMKSYI